jgi:hypothetical protein
MASERKNTCSTDKLPLAVYAIVVCFVGWMAIAAWGFSGPGYAELSLAVVTGLLIVAVAIPFVIWRVGRAAAGDRPDDRIRFGEWKRRQFEIWQDRQKGISAAIEIVLPIAAAAIGMTAFAIVFHYAATHGLA